MYWKELDVWKESHKLTLEIFKITENLPGEEKFGIIAQMRRASYSVPLNIVEGHSRRSSKEFLQFINISRGSLEELRYLNLLCQDLKYYDDKIFSQIETKAEKIESVKFSV
jgi:four helix bundle protein